MNLPDKLPDGVSVFIACSVRIDVWHCKIELSHKISQMQYLKYLLQTTWAEREIRIYPIDSSIKCTKIEPSEAWNEGMTIEEFEEYLCE